MKETAMGFKFGLINQDTKDIGRMIKRMVRELCITLMETFIRVIGRMIKLTAGVSIHTTMERLMKENGKKTSKTERVQKLGQMELSISVNIKTGKSMEKGSFILQIEVFMKDLSLRMKFQAKVYTHGMMAKSTKVNGNKTKWTERDD
jgi:predicted hydrocarbon binding protein